ncbi:MAG: hypothetical protein IRZ28_11920 [Steroidobacteraceae bacterium]|jgi:hypothetical protein|nr:hypothetical protein [Steroidobacteraceae bacterium]
MLTELRRFVARASSTHRALVALESVPEHVLLIAPSTPGSFALARQLCRRRSCYVSSGALTQLPCWNLTAHLKHPADIARAFAGQTALPRTVISFPDQHAPSGSACVLIPFLQTRYAFSSFEALLVARHKPRVYAVATRSRACDFILHEVRYDELFSPDGRLLSLPGLVRRLMMHLEQDLTRPAPDWLAADVFRLQSEPVRWLHIREELKDVECLLRMHLQSRYCDRVRTEAALAAVVARQRLFMRPLASAMEGHTS